jgi:hypothetical protein
MVETFINMLLAFVVIATRIMVPIMVEIGMLLAKLALIIGQILFGWLGGVFSDPESRRTATMIGGGLTLVGIIVLVAVNL